MTTHYEYIPSGVCSRRFIFELEDGKIASLQVEGGCNGNLKGIASLIKGREITEVIGLLEGIECGMKPTSCPDQISKALKSYINA